MKLLTLSIYPLTVPANCTLNPPTPFGGRHLMHDETVIIYSSDHGAHLEDHDLIHKGTHYDRSARVPFVVRYPKMIRPKRTKAFSSHVDLMPTVLELAGIEAPRDLEEVFLETDWLKQ